MQNTNLSQTSNRVLIVGGGLAGIRAALDLAEAQKDVILVDTAENIGGLMTQLDRTFPTNNCDLCTLAPNLSESGRQEHITLMPMTTLREVTGEQGNFIVTLETAPRYINLDRCTGCGECFQAFPECVRFTPGLDHRAPTCMRYPQATPQAFSIDLAKCTDIEALVKVCPAGAIVPDDIGSKGNVACGAIVLAPGASLFDPSGLDYLGYGELPDVVTSLEYERILSASGPTGGRLLRPSNGQPPKKVAWIQCIGSRGLQKGAAPYCSGACCMFALKEAIVTRERFQEDTETTIFYMDMRTFGKDYELYYQRAKNEFGVRFIHSRPHSILRPEGAENLHLSYTTDDSPVLINEEFDMVVLATGFRIGEEARQLAAVCGIELNDDHFPIHTGLNQVATSRPGIYVAGTFQAPKDIPETMVQASAAACLAGHDVSSPEREEEIADPLPPERHLVGEEPRVGIFVCDCGENIGGVVDVEALVARVGALPHVTVAQAAGHGCSRESMEHIRATIEQQGINRVVIGGCSPRTHEAKFQDLLRRAGLNKYLLEFANIRDQATWVHAHQPEKATKKAEELIRMALGAVLKAQPLAEHRLPINKNVLVVGGGVSGMTAALELAEQGFKVYLVERNAQLGGLAPRIHRTLEGDDVQEFVADLVARTSAHSNIDVITSAIIVDHGGMPGLFKTGMQVGKQLFYRQIEHGITILATGAMPHRPDLFLLGKHEDVKTQLETQQLLEERPELVRGWENVVMIQCVGSRTEDNPNCSRICCQTAVKNALRILEINPEARVFVLYRDMRTYAFQEEYYQQARAKGVIFVRYHQDRPPQVSEVGGKLEVVYQDIILGREVQVSTDCLCLSTGLIAEQDNTEELAMIFKLPRTNDGYFLEDHIKLRPVDLPVPGFFVAGTAHAPKTIAESLVQARAVAARAQTMLASDYISLGAATARVDSKLCAACLICVRACPFGVPFINADGYSEIDPARCHGCGVCASECPAKAIQLMQFEDDRILSKLEQLFEEVEG
ncbi:MAG: FAD-dependent oxidoreductase [Desulfofustis sp.]|jgi:heterodisulfide reductase subunit A|nr:FAD-dependent oxidoreductase [Desulfofustis sp.]